MDISLTEQVVWRFVRAGISSAFSTAAAVTYFTGVQTWMQAATAFNALSLSLLIGFVTGVLMAADKYFKGPTVPVDSENLVG